MSTRTLDPLDLLGNDDAALRLTRRFRPYGALVGNTVAFLRRVVDAAAHARATRLDGDAAVSHFSGESGIPLVLLRDDMALDVGAVRAFLEARVHGQSAAVERVAEIVAVIKAGLADQRRPVGGLFFAGPTGVGKTELSKALAEYVFGARERMVRLDMGEYAGGDALARLIGDAGTPGHLTAAVRRQPFSVVLLDEIEKAHPVVFDALLGVLGEGRLTDAAGKFTDFRNAIVIMTSNLGADTLRARVGFAQQDAARAAEAVRQHYRAEAERFFRPELFNRIDDFIVFAALDAPVLRGIVTREVARLAAREGLRRHNVELKVDDRALDVLSDHGFDPRYGARPLKRTLERELALPIAALRMGSQARQVIRRQDIGGEIIRPSQPVHVIQRREIRRRIVVDDIFPGQLPGQVAGRGQYLRGLREEIGVRLLQPRRRIAAIARRIVSDRLVVRSVAPGGEALRRAVDGDGLGLRMDRSRPERECRGTTRQYDAAASVVFDERSVRARASPRIRLPRVGRARQRRRPL